MTGTESSCDERAQKKRLFTITKFFFIITLIYILWVAVVVMGVYYLELGSKWAILTMEQWILSGIALVSVAIGLEIVLLIQSLLSKAEKPEPVELKKQKEYIQGKQLHSYTIPLDAKGGIFSKTYILIDEERVLNIRYQMIPPKDLWGPQQ